MPEAVMTGGCQCGSKRYALASEPRVSLCFCRMCQKAGGNYFGAFANVAATDLSWKTEKPSIFSSSEAAERGFCEKCGTSLTFQYRGSQRISVTAGSLDEPARVRPTVVHGVEGKPGWFDELCQMAGTRTEDDVPPEKRARLASRQHPDHED